VDKFNGLVGSSSAIRIDDRNRPDTNSMTHPSYVSMGAYCGNSRCGYCGSDNTAQNFGFYSPLMSVETYEAMLNRGWRRSSLPNNLISGAGGTCINPIYGIPAAHFMLFVSLEEAYLDSYGRNEFQAKEGTSKGRKSVQQVDQRRRVG
jgi:hypothetical protein